MTKRLLFTYVFYCTRKNNEYIICRRFLVFGSGKIVFQVTFVQTHIIIGYKVASNIAWVPCHWL